MNLLFQWSEQGLFAVEGDDFLIPPDKVEGAKDQSDDEDSSQGSKVKKILEDDFQKALKTTQQRGFQWMLEAHDAIDPNKSQAYILETMRGEKVETEMRQMYDKVDRILKRNIEKLSETLQKSLSEKIEKDESMIDTEMKDEESSNKEVIQQIQKVSSSLRIIQRLIINQKEYYKESIKLDISFVCLRNLGMIVKLLSESPQTINLLKDTKQAFSVNFNKLIFDFMALLMSLVQLTHLQANFYQFKLPPSATRRPEEMSEFIKKKIESIRKRVPAKQIIDITMSLLDFAAAGVIKSQILMSSFSLALRIIIDKESLESVQRETAIEQLFTQLTEVTQKNKNVRIDQKIISSIAILYFENDSVIL